MPTISAVPTNIITGFLGVGKTTAILHLLQHKPQGERWAVLVNEFGEIGIDGSLFTGQNHHSPSEVFVKEVPGGCMCCTAGLPMQIALNQLLKRARPDRLLLEPTGLGHPKEVLQVLNAEYYRDVIKLQRSIALVDARKLHDVRYTENDTFNQQLDIADLIVGNKQDLYEPGDQALLSSYIQQRKGRVGECINGSINGSINSTVAIEYVSHGKIDPAWLQGQTHYSLAVSDSSDHHHTHSAVNLDMPELPACGYLKIENKGEGFKSIGWRFSSEYMFDRAAIFSWFNGLQVERLKAVLITPDGIFAYNLAEGVLTEMDLDDLMESRIEIIAEQLEEGWHHELLQLSTKAAF
ncbi:Zinc-binding GTPase YeiR [Thalassocella blandensis]|nr:Zinc-binding GTPase YeiR [Thalassocella blandensis]